MRFGCFLFIALGGAFSCLVRSPNVDFYAPLRPFVLAVVNLGALSRMEKAVLVLHLN
jgi:hypothetical protein